MTLPMGGLGFSNVSVCLNGNLILYECSVTVVNYCLTCIPVFFKDTYIKHKLYSINVVQLSRLVLNVQTFTML